MGIHDKHRERLRERFLKFGLDTFDDHNAIELLLLFAIPRKDMNEVAHHLLNRFGTLAAVFDAPFSELIAVPGIGPISACFLKLIPQICRRYLISRSGFDVILNTSQKAGDYLVSHFYAERDEVVYMVCLDAKCKVLNCQLLFRGGVNSTSVSIRKIVENALVYNSTSAIIAHNHTSGIAIPSKEAEATTRKIYEALNAVGIELADHIVVADEDFVSMYDSGFFKNARKSSYGF